MATLVTAATTALTEATDLPDGEATAFGVNIASLNTGLVNARNSVVAAQGGGRRRRGA